MPEMPTLGVYEKCYAYEIIHKTRTEIRTIELIFEVRITGYERKKKRRLQKNSSEINGNRRTRCAQYRFRPSKIILNVETRSRGNRTIQ